MLEPDVSEMSCISHPDLTVSGLEMGPRRMEGEKHSRIVETSLSDFCHEYQRHASPVDFILIKLKENCLKTKRIKFGVTWFAVTSLVRLCFIKLVTFVISRRSGKQSSTLMAQN
jgi:hypothetical protein